MLDTNLLAFFEQIDRLLCLDLLSLGSIRSVLGIDGPDYTYVKSSKGSPDDQHLQ